jgi:hypothetical protein
MFDSMVHSLSQSKTKKTNVSLADYMEFCSLKNTAIRKLRDKPFGSAFCEYFDISNFILENVVTEQTAKDTIELSYLSDADNAALKMVSEKLGENKLW